jgi:hypothetical protein
MRKLRSDALWHTFTAEQQKKIQQWLFDDHFSYQRTRELMKTELGLTCALSTLCNIHNYLDELRSDSAWLNAHDLAGQVIDSGANLEKLRSASQLLLASRFLQTVTHRGSVQEIATLGRLMLQHESQEISRTRTDLADERTKLRTMQPPFRTEPRPPWAASNEIKPPKTDA